jgi:hypothetical protein
VSASPSAVDWPLVVVVVAVATLDVTAVVVVAVVTVVATWGVLTAVVTVVVAPEVEVTLELDTGAVASVDVVVEAVVVAAAVTVVAAVLAAVVVAAVVVATGTEPVTGRITVGRTTSGVVDVVAAVSTGWNADFTGSTRSYIPGRDNSLAARLTSSSRSCCSWAKVTWPVLKALMTWVGPEAVGKRVVLGHLSPRICG